jgi:iron complex transport system ATP-binding protein
MGVAMLEVKNISCGYGTRIVVENVSFTLGTGELLCLLGPNGVGKTTLFRTILGSLERIGGEVLLNGEDVRRLNLRHLARKIAYVPQAHTPPFPFRVIDVVTMGRTAHFCVFSSPTTKDVKIAEDALRTMNIEHLREKSYTEISGGERQLVLVARALAQQAELLVMDEPTSNLDFGNQIRVLEHIRTVVRTQQVSVILTTHSPNHALAYASKVAIIGRDKSFAVGAPEEMISERYLRETYRVEAELFGIHTRHGKNVRFCIPLSARGAESSDCVESLQYAESLH